MLAIIRFPPRMPLNFRTQRKGQSLIEIVVAMGMVVFFGTAFVTLVSTNYGRLEQSRDQSQATLLGQEAINAVRTRASTNFDSLDPSKLYGLDSSTGEIYPLPVNAPGDTTGQAPDTVFTRKIEIQTLQRTGSIEGPPTADNVAGVPDLSGRYVKVTVAWENQYKSGTAVLYTIVSDWDKVGAIVFDTVDDFSGLAAIQCGATIVNNFIPGGQSSETDGSNALGMPDEGTDPAVTLGIGQENPGSEIVLEFPNVIKNVTGNDLTVFETSGPMALEQARVFARLSNTDPWIDIGVATNGLNGSFNENNKIPSSLDLGVSLPNGAKYIKLVDTTTPGNYNNGTTTEVIDGFDLNAVVGKNCVPTSAVQDLEMHTSEVVKEVFNGEVRISQVGGLESPAQVALTPSITLEDSGNTYDIAVAEDDLYVVNDSELRVYSIGNVSAEQPTVVLKKTIPLALGLRSIAVSDTHIFIGTSSNPEVKVIDRSTLSENSPAEIDWNLTGNGIVTDLFYDKQNNRLLVTRTSPTETDPSFFGVDIPSPMNNTPDIIREQRVGTEGLNRVTSDGAFAYVGTTSNKIIAICLHYSCGNTAKTIVNFNPQTDAIGDLAMIKNVLYVGRALHATEPELMAFKVKWNLPLGTVALDSAGSANIQGSVKKISASLDLNRIVVTSSSTQTQMLVFNQNLATLSSFNLPVGNNCAGIDFEAGRAFAACKIGTGPSNLLMVEDSVGKSIFSPFASYVTPSRCADTTSHGFTGWKLLAFKESGLGYSDIQIRTAPTIAELQNRSWRGQGAGNDTSPTGFFTDDTTWHDISNFPAEPCIQARIRFRTSAFCPLYLETLIFTYE